MMFSEPQLPLPTLPGKVHGIVGVDPLQIQCDGCGRVGTRDGEPLILFVRAFPFPSRTAAGGRFCPDCRGAA